MTPAWQHPASFAAPFSSTSLVKEGSISTAGQKSANAVFFLKKKGLRLHGALMSDTQI
jgi:hypothetical protein